MSKLTLSVDHKVIEKAKEIASERGTNVSAMFSQFIETLADQTDQKKHTKSSPLPPLTRRAVGIAKMPSDKSYRSLIEEALVERQK